ncbi:MAG: right-handed parallel beta-helix repeat-containing protein [Nitrosotalea sp.]
MNLQAFLSILSIFAISSLLFGSVAFATNDPDNITLNQHCTVTINGENVGDNAIQSAIDASASGSTICLDAAVYHENIVITKPLTLEGVGHAIQNGESHNLNDIAILEPTNLVSTTSDIDNSHNLSAPIILVQGGSAGLTGVTIQNLEVNGNIIGSKLTDCGLDASNPEPVGIMFQSASGTIDDVVSLDVESNQALFGCQDDAGLGIFVQTATGLNSNVLIKDSSITNYQKNGITCNDAGTSCDVSNDVVAGIGQTTLTAQNGVQIAYGATGTIENSQISGDSYSAASDTEDYFTSLYQATGILLFDAPGVVISNNAVSLSDIGMWVGGDNTLSANNDASNNVFLKNYGYGVVFDSFNGTSTNNFFQNNPVGLLVTDYSSNANVTSINDQFMNNVVNNEALGVPGSTWFADLVVETSGHPIHVPHHQHNIHHFPTR